MIIVLQEILLIFHQDFNMNFLRMLARDEEVPFFQPGLDRSCFLRRNILSYFQKSYLLFRLSRWIPKMALCYFTNLPFEINDQCQVTGPWSLCDPLGNLLHCWGTIYSIGQPTRESRYLLLLHLAMPQAVSWQLSIFSCRWSSDSFSLHSIFHR